MLLEGACHCGAVRFRVEAYAPAPFMLCYCSICRKTAGGGGFAVNLGARAETMTVEGREHVTVYHPILHEPDEPTAGAPVSEGERAFCSRCGSALWAYHPGWPELIHPHASAIDTPLPEPPQRLHIMQHYRVPWALVDTRSEARFFDEYPDESLEAWHRRHGLLEE